MCIFPLGPASKSGAFALRVSLKNGGVQLRLSHQPPDSFSEKAGHLRLPHSASWMPYWCWRVLCLNSPSGPGDTRRRELKGWLALVNAASLRFLAPECVWEFSQLLDLADTACLLTHLSGVRLSATLWTVTLCSTVAGPWDSPGKNTGLACPPPGGLSNPGIEILSLVYPALEGRFFTISTTWEAEIVEWSLVLNFLTMFSLGARWEWMWWLEKPSGD